MIRLLGAFSAVAVGLGAARALTTAYVPVLLDRIAHRPGLIGAVMLVNAAAGFLVPLAAGWWSDRRPDGRFGRRGPFILGGVLVAAGGLVAIALGTASSYFALTLAAATVYVGLNAATTAHRALVAEHFEDAHRPRATGAQEIAMLLGALAGTVAGGMLVDASPALLFAGAAVVVPLLALPTLASRVVRRPATATAAPPARPRARVAAPARSTARSAAAELLRAARTPGAREVLAAQVLWVFAYAALAPFMVLYAEDVLGIGAASAGLLLAAFGVLTGAGMLAGGALPPRLVRPALLTGATLLGTGLVVATPASTVSAAAVPFAAAAVGAGLVTALGFPYFARFIPAGQEGSYSGVFFSSRAISTTLALPSAGGIVALTGSYRALLAQGGAAVLALVPLLRAERRPAREPLPGPAVLLGVVREWWPRLTLGVLAVCAIGVALPAIQSADERAFLEMNAIGDGPEWLYQALDPHSRNYALLVLAAVLAALFARRLRWAAGAALAMVLAAFASDAVLEIFQILFDRPRPEETIGAHEILLTHDRTWSHIPSFPSGHLMVTAAMVATAIAISSRLRWPLLIYLAAIAITRVTFGAHFPLDVVVGAAIGWEVGLFSVALVRSAGLLPAAEPRPDALVAPAPVAQR